MKQWSSRFGILLLAAVYLLTGGLGNNFFYFCVTEQGTLRIEFGVSDGCRAASHGENTLSTAEEMAALSHNDPCGNCTDLSLDNGFYIRSDSKIRILPADQPMAGIFIPSLSSVIALMTSFEAAPAGGDFLHAVTNLRSVILLI
jgi:hypothetical protein